MHLMTEDRGGINSDCHEFNRDKMVLVPSFLLHEDFGFGVIYVSIDEIEVSVVEPHTRDTVILSVVTVSLCLFRILILRSRLAKFIQFLRVNVVPVGRCRP